jgi:SAM-dependent methyltransferase
MVPWHNHDDFWMLIEPILFSWQRREEAPKQVGDILTLLELEPPANVLDLCCGIGRHSLEFARLGFDVTAVDRTKAYLEKASRQAEGAGLKIKFVQDDMRTYRKDNTYDLALSLYTSFGYFENPEDDCKVIQNLHASLRPGGVLLMDMMGKEIIARVFRARDWYEEDDCIVLQERSLGKNWAWMENRWIILRGKDRTDLKFSHRLYSATEISMLLKRCGFGEVSIYGNYHGSAYDNKATRLVAVAKKSASV